MIGRTREERKVAAYLRAQLSLKHALERIDYAEDVVKPQLQELRAASQLNHVDVEIVGELEPADASA